MKSIILRIKNPGLVIILGFIGIVAIIASCKKDGGMQNNHQTIAQASEFLPKPGQVIPLILKFKNEHSHFKEGLKTWSDMPLEQALWTIEASANYDFASEKDSVPDFEYDSLIVEIDSYYDSGELMLEGESIMEAYDDIIDFINQGLNAAPSTVLIAADLSIINVGTPLVSFELSTVSGPIVAGNYSINSTDYWYAANELGKCGSYIGQQIGKDASDRIDQVLDWNHGIAYACANGGNVFYTSIDEISLADDCTNGWCFWNGSSCNECLDPTDMAYWVGVAEDVIEDNRPAGKVFIDVEYKDDFWPGTPSTWVHRVNPVRYGVINCTSSEGE